MIFMVYLKYIYYDFSCCFKVVFIINLYQYFYKLFVFHIHDSLIRTLAQL